MNARARENLAAGRKRVARILALLRKRWPAATTALNWRNPLELLVATILSAQCTDARVNVVTKSLFAKYRTAADYAAADPAVLEQEIHSAGFFRNKTKSIIGAARMLVAKHGGRVPDAMDALLELPGVARKTANVVLGTAFGKNEGIVVDTHVQRLAGRLGLTKHKTNQGDKIEHDLMQLVPRDAWTEFGHMLVFHGRYICTARKPACDECTLNKLCPLAFKA